MQAAPPMQNADVDRDRFWEDVDAARARVVDVDEVPAALVEVLRGRPLAELVAFREVQDELFDREAYRWDLWAAAYVINGGASDDGFEYFLGWLMAQGRTRWEATLADPDSLADVVDADTGDLDCEEMLYVAPTAAEDEEAFWAALPDKGEHLPPGPAGERFDFEDEDRMRRLLPRLTAIFYDEDER
ncbi:DUF4240 domain-containing protein [Dactylosporangium siamense]|uniref:DUF4240 domain-containing protein n=1 Tax=Dactylosporangium siamense TaxID=685454 RepID=A0A919UH13_9ACTN|nr:DUF4240 domain-containing protein [Dactylosporangium siamense]GIG50233.1 hypothetical protein Dsi01nite_082740 [Dactylosporangium siamense]